MQSEALRLISPIMRAASLPPRGMRRTSNSGVCSDAGVLGLQRPKACVEPLCGKQFGVRTTLGDMQSASTMVDSR